MKEGEFVVVILSMVKRMEAMTVVMILQKSFNISVIQDAKDVIFSFTVVHAK